MGFKDGTRNAQDLAKSVWVGDEGPAWMRGGSYVVVRKIRMALEHWDKTDVDFQEEVIGRRKRSGAPIGRERERDAPDFEASGPGRQPGHRGERASAAGGARDQWRHADPAARLLLQ